MMKNENIELGNIRKENIFKVSENYFSDLPMRIQEQTSGKTKVVPFISWSRQRTLASITACSIIGVLGYFTLMPQQDSLGNESLAGVKNQEIENYLIQENINQSDISEQIYKNKTINFQDYELLDNLKVTDNDVWQTIEYENIYFEI